MIWGFLIALLAAVAGADWSSPALAEALTSHHKSVEDGSSLNLAQHSAFLILKTFSGEQIQAAATAERDRSEASLGLALVARLLGGAGFNESPWKVVLVRVCFPLCGCFVGAACILAGRRTSGLIAVYFGVNTGFSLYTKFLLMLVPAPFVITALQQVVSVTVLLLALLLLAPTPWAFWPRSLTSWSEVLAILIFALAFAANIGLNNFSLSLLPVSMNLTIRSCLPLVALVAQVLWSPVSRRSTVERAEVALVLVGTACACLAAWAKGEASAASPVVFEVRHYFCGIFFCFLSVVAAAVMLVLADILGSRMAFSPLDTTWYMSLPAALFLIPAAAFCHHPTDWSTLTDPTDFEVLRLIVSPSHTTLFLILCSGVFALGHNVLLYFLIKTLSPSHVAFAGNVNKAMTIISSMAIGLESVPTGLLGIVMTLAMFGNIAAFTSYSAVKDVTHDAKLS